MTEISSHFVITLIYKKWEIINYPAQLELILEQFHKMVIIDFCG